MPNPRRDIPWLEIEKRYRESPETVQEIAEAFGVPRSTICGRAHRHGWKPRRPRYKRENPPKAEHLSRRLYRLLESKMSALEEQCLFSDDPLDPEHLVRELINMTQALTRLQELETKLESLHASASGKRNGKNPRRSSGRGPGRAALRTELERRLARLLAAETEGSVPQ